MTTEPTSPSRHDSVTIPCGLCQRPFAPTGRQRWCGNACRAAAYRRRKQAVAAPVALPAPKPRRPHTVYECDSCGTRSLGEQRCDDCGTFMRRIGIGGHCQHCFEPLAIVELVGAEPGPNT